MATEYLAALYRQLSVLYGAGISPAESFKLLASQERGGGKRRFQEVQERLWRGERVSQAMKSLPRTFPASHCMLVVEGETTGRLDQTLVRLAEMTEHSIALRRMMAAELRVSTITCIVALPLVIILLPIIAPPAVVAFAWTLIGTFAFLMALSHLAINLPGKGRAWATRVARAVPDLGTIAKSMTLGYFSRSFALLFNAGVPISAALRCAADSTADDSLIKAAKSAVVRMDRGESMLESLGASGIIPPYMLGLINAGELAGGLGTLMEGAAKIYEEEASASLHTFAQWTGVTAYLIMAVLTFIIGFFFYAHLLASPDGRL